MFKGVTNIWQKILKALEKINQKGENLPEESKEVEFMDFIRADLNWKNNIYI